MLKSIRPIFQTDEFAEARPFYLIITFILLSTVSLTLFEPPNPMTLSRLPLFGLLFAFHLTLHWVSSYAASHTRWRIPYLLGQGVLALALVAIAQHPGLALALFATLVTETLGLFGLTRVPVLGVVGYLGLTAVSYLMLGGPTLLMEWVSPTVSTMTLLIIFIVMYRRQSEARKESQHLLAELAATNRQLADYRPISDDKPFLDNYYHLPSLLSIGFWKDYFAGNSQLAFSHHLLHFYNFAFVLVLILAGALMLGATLLIKRREVRIRRDLPWLYFFSCLGLAFMFVEISFLYQFILYLANPIYSFSVILAGVLFSLGLGSLASDKLCGSRRLNLRTIAILCAGILVAGYVYIPWVITRTLGMGLAWRILLAFVIILPTGFILGMMFPQGIKLVGRINRNLLPLAWGLNGYLSVIGSALSIYLAPIVGFSGLSLIGAALYVTLVLIPLGMPEEG